MTDEARKPPDVEVVEEKLEDRAVRHVIGLERRLGREARNTRRIHGAPADIASGDRQIEVKASSGWQVRKNGLLYVTGPQLRRASDPNFYLYDRREHGPARSLEDRGPGAPRRGPAAALRQREGGHGSASSIRSTPPSPSSGALNR